ncbi:MAG: hypothetical protein MUF54_18980 [Polyangiaceae bacterium]|jgi:hypothetical protein|nr:hypothetical protein [Polyangiaceae bacterium]
MQSIRNAILGQPDERTQAAMKLLLPALSDQERVYLEHMHWDSVSEDTAGDDPAIRKGLEALLAAGGRGTATRAALRPLAPPGQVTSPGGGVGTDLYGDARKVMLACYGEATCNGLGCVAATLQAHLDVYGPIGSPAKPPGYADLGAWQCSIDFKGGGVVEESCAFQGWCWQETIEFPGGKSTCHDPGWTPGPNATCGESAISDAGPDAPQLVASCMPKKNTSTGNIACGSGLTCTPHAKYAAGQQADIYGGTCGAPRKQGETCFEFGCAAGLRCIGEAADRSLSQCNTIPNLVGECVALGGIGTPCFANDCYCQEGTFCGADPYMTIWQCE